MPSGSGRAARLDAVTVDGFGTLLELEDPTERLTNALRAAGIDRLPSEVASAFRAEAAYYRPRSHEGCDPASLEALRVECVGVFLDHLAADLEPRSFVASFVDSIVFRVADGALAAVDRLRAAGLALACVANWDVGLHEHLHRLDLTGRFETVVSSADARAQKPDPAIFALALERLGVPAERALHVGDEDVDRDGAAAAGLEFEPAPLATLPERLDL
jgi:putative hydrolase of the HAD superfamily